MVTLINRKIAVYILVLVQINFGKKIDKALLCSQNYCEVRHNNIKLAFHSNESYNFSTQTYLKQYDCPDLSEECLSQNATHSGLYIPAPTFCNCCQFCLTYLGNVRLFQ